MKTCQVPESIVFAGTILQIFKKEIVLGTRFQKIGTESNSNHKILVWSWSQMIFLFWSAP